MQELKKDVPFLFSKLKTVLEKENARLLVNLESPFVTESNIPFKKKITLYAFPPALAYLAYLNPYLVNLSNNHINDYGSDSVKYTFDLLDKASICYFGAGLKNKNFHLHVVSEEKTVFLAYATRSSDFTGSALFAENDFYGVRNVELNEIKSVRKKYPSYTLVVNVHWGVEDIKYPEPEKVKLGRRIIDAGADLLIGHHPHIIQPYEKYKGKYIFYSVGNLYFNDIHYSLNNEIHFKKALRHQKRGLIPIFTVGDKEPHLDRILSNRITDNGDLIVGESKIGENTFLLKIPFVLYSVLYHSYVFFTLWINRAGRVITNPKLLLKKLIKK